MSESNAAQVDRDLFDEFGRGLSRQQVDCVLRGDDIFLQACPGSGKTHSIVARVAMRIATGKRIAVVTHTRVAAKEFKDRIFTDFATELSGDHFGGTVHSFISKYVLAPFGHLATGASQPIAMGDDEVDARRPADVDVSFYRFDPNGAMVPTREHRTMPTAQRALEVKKALAREGFVSYDDALYWSGVVLRDHPEIACAVAGRFDELLIDEAQDCSELQLWCVELLRASGLRSLVMVGDFDQSIYAFGGADPKLCERLAARAGLERRKLTENWRSSQLLCNMTAAFRASKVPDIAVGPAAEFELAPLLIRYSDPDLLLLVDCMDAFVRGLGLHADQSAVVARRHALLGQLAPRAWISSAEYYRSLILLAGSREVPQVADLRIVETVVRRAAVGRESSDADPAGELLLRNGIFQLIAELSNLDLRLSDWLRLARTKSLALSEELGPLTSEASTIPGVPYVPARFTAESWRRQLLGGVPGSIGLSTVHSVKGKSLDAVMLVAGPDGEADDWASALVSERSAEHTEETRVAYVALTRARKLAVLAVPEDTSRAVVGRFLDAGFKAGQLQPLGDESA